MDDKISRQPSILLRPLGVSDEKQALQAHEEFAQDDFEFLLGLEQGAPWPAYCGRLESQRLGVDIPEGWVPATFLVAEAEGQIVGRVSIRHALNAHLAEVGGGTSDTGCVLDFVAAVTRRPSCASPWRSRRRLVLSVCW